MNAKSLVTPSSNPKLQTYRVALASTLLLLIAALLLSSCAPTTIQDTTEIDSGTSIVFGHVDAFVDGEKKEWGTTWTGTETLVLIILPPNTNKALTYELSDDGDFFWNLDPGEYTVLGYKMFSGSETRSGRLWYAFEVPEEARNIYIGKIRIDMQGSRYKGYIEDDFDVMAALFEQRFPSAEKPTKELLRTEEPLGNYEYVKSVCSANWGIECTSRNRGVKPVSPEVMIDGFPLTASLTPTFKWEPSPHSNVSYDLVIYEAASHNYFYSPGRLALYRENIQQPSFTPKAALKPETRYYWSVRLRDGDLVSDWSSSGYKFFLVIVGGSQQGSWFGFSTPHT